ncbi:uncharacterized protein LOC125943011 [Dermacentor silvarum]|uniref:uncharacterized protein LOC125943011 n=1 Tax=Dermacentor silvarum TaxID=543639 RepID=UPI002101274A|nr:uncharacterized protein LOC125943011 [Dermacentor silvarum]
MTAHSSRTWHGLQLAASLAVATLTMALVFTDSASAGRPVHPYPHLSRRGRELEYFPGVGLVEPLGLLAVASLPLFVLFSVMWLVFPLWFKFHHFGLYGHGLVPGILPGAAAAGVPAAGRRRRRDLLERKSGGESLTEVAARVVKALRDGLDKYT